MASDEEHEEEDDQVLILEPEEEQLQLRDLERILSIPLDILTALEVSEEFGIVPGLILNYVQAKEEEMKKVEEVVEEYNDVLQDKDVKIEDLERELSVVALTKTEIENRYSDLQSELEEHKENAQSLMAAQGEAESLKVSIEEYQTTLRELQDEIESLQNQSNDLQTTNSNLQEELEKANTTIEDLKPAPDVPGADRDQLLRLLDRRQKELTQLANSWSGLSERLEITSSEKQAIQLKLDELVSQESSVQLKEQLLSREKLMIQQQNDWLSKELEIKSNQVLELKKERSAILTDKEMLVSSKDQELNHLRASLSSKTELLQEVQGRLDSAHSRLMEVREEQANVEDQLRKELASQSKLATLYQTASNDGEKLVLELMSKLESLQSSLDELRTSKEVALKTTQELKERLSVQESESSSRIQVLEEELKNANELLSTARRQGTLPLTEGEVLSISPAATGTSSLLTSGLTLTQIYTQYVQSTDELQLVKDENARLNNYLTQIMEELDEKTPALQKLRRDHDSLLKRCQEQQEQIKGLVDEFDNVRLESEESIKFSRSLERENKRLKTLSSDLGRQVKVLLKEVEEARGGVASTSHDWSHDLSSDDVTSSSQVISDHLVLFRNVEELQEQNQKLLAVVRELGETREKEENIIETQATSEMKQRLEEAVRELNLLKESRERQKEMVESIVKQRDMYRILLAQSTPLPDEHTDTSQLSTSQDSASIFASPQKTTPTTNAALQELKEQFEAYRKEKSANDSILQEQISQYRDEAAKATLDKATLASKLEYSTERYHMLESSYKELKGELSALRNKEKLLNNSLNKSHETVDRLTKELLSSHENLSRLEIRQRALQSERDHLFEGEKRSRKQYEDLMKEQSSQSLLLTNLQTLQNNLERNEYETKSRLGSQIEILEKEAGLLKERLHNEEEKRERIKDAYETQVQDLSQKLLTVQSEENVHLQTISSLEERASNAESALAVSNGTLDEVRGQLEEARDRLRAMEEDAGAEFRSSIRILERKVTDGNAKITSLQDQLKSVQSHADQYKSISEANEKALVELNATSEIFKNNMSQQVEALKEREGVLKTELESIKEEKERIENELKAELKESEMELQSAQQKIAEMSKRLEEAERIMREAQKDQQTAREDAKRCLDSSREHEELYQRELVQHGHTMESLNKLKEKEEEREGELNLAREENVRLKEEMETLGSTHKELESMLFEEKRQADERSQHLSSQNDLLHSEAETLSAKLITLTQQISEGAGSMGVVPATVLEQDGGSSESDPPPTSSENLWEVIRYVRREKEISETKRDLAESQVSSLKQTINQLTHQLEQTRQQLQELTDATTAHESISVEYEKIMKDLQTLNALSDSNRLLRDENKSLEEKVSSLKASNQDSLVKIQSLKDSQQSLSSQKDALLVEKVALKKEVERWNQRTNQLIEQYNKIDPEEYRQLVQEKDERDATLSQMKSDSESLQREKLVLEESLSQLSTQFESLKKKEEEQETELTKLQSETKGQKEELGEKNRLIIKVKDIGRRYRTTSEEFKKKFEDSEAKRTELESQIEELQRSLPESTNQQLAINDLQTQLDKTKEELEASKTAHETLTATMAEKDDKISRIIRTARTMKLSKEQMKNEKDNIEKELEEIKALHNENRTALEEANAALQSQLASLQSQYDADTKRLEERIEKLEGDLRTKTVTRRRVVQPTVVVPVESPSTTVTAQAAPTAAIRPTVTTTPTASIRPMPLQMTTAPTAHVTPTQVTTTIPITSEATPTPSSSSSGSTVGSAAVFMRSTSPLLVTQTTPPQVTPTSSVSEGAGPSVGTRPLERPVKRTREATTESSSAEQQPPPVKRSRQQIVEAEPSTTTSTDPLAPPTDTPTESDRSPDTQSDQDVVQPDDETTPLVSMVMEPSANVSSADVAVVADVSRRAESEGPTSSVVADTTSGTDQLVGSEQQQDTGRGDPEGGDENEEGRVEPTVAMDTEPTTFEGNEEEEGGGDSGAVIEIMEEEEEGERGRNDEVIEIEDDDEGTLEPTSGVPGGEVTASSSEVTDERGEEEEVEEGEIEEQEEEEEEEERENNEEQFDEQEEEEIEEEEEEEEEEIVEPPIVIQIEDEEQNIGLPENEDVIEITAPSSLSGVQVLSHTVPAAQSLSVPLERRLAQRERASTPGGTVELNVMLPSGGDHQVPCTPVLAEDKQLGKAPALQSVPADLTAPTSSSVSVSVQQLEEEREDGGQEATSSQGDTLFEVTQFGELSSTTASVPVPPSHSTHSSHDDQSHDPSPQELEEEEEEGQPLSGDLGDDVIAEIIASSSCDEEEEEDIEEGELGELQTIDSTHQDEATPILPSRTVSAPVAIATQVPPSSISGGVPGSIPAVGTSTTAPASTVSQDTARKEADRKIQPIVWDESQPSTSGPPKVRPKLGPPKSSLSTRRAKGRGRKF